MNMNKPIRLTEVPPADRLRVLRELRIKHRYSTWDRLTPQGIAHWLARESDCQPRLDAGAHSPLKATELEAQVLACLDLIGQAKPMLLQEFTATERVDLLRRLRVVFRDAWQGKSAADIAEALLTLDVSCYDMEAPEVLNEVFSMERTDRPGIPSKQEEEILTAYAKIVCANRDKNLSNARTEADIKAAANKLHHGGDKK